MVYELELYVTLAGRVPFGIWYEGVRNLRLKQAVDRRLARALTGNFGDCKPCGEGVWKLRLDIGPGYRLYYAIADGRIILLLGAGDKSSQTTDINRAIDCWNEWRRRQ